LESFAIFLELLPLREPQENRFDRQVQTCNFRKTVKLLSSYIHVDRLDFAILPNTSYLPPMALALLLALSACSPRHLIIHGVANELANQGNAAEDDLVLAREASAFYLKLSESLLTENPANLKLAEAVSAGFTQYAFAFVSTDAERIESKDAKAAQKLRERAARLYLRAKRHGMSALEAGTPGFARALAQSDAKQWPRLTADQIGVAYWTAAAWGGYISLSKDNPDTVADLPLAVRLATLAYSVNPEHGQGALASLMGTLEASRPGGSVRQASAYFDQAIALGAGKNAGAFVGKAEAIALPANDRPAFESLLRQAISASQARRDIANEVMGERAQWLLGVADDLF
jgi:predicted anti-sigma-YlaC factor YlaD